MKKVFITLLVIVLTGCASQQFKKVAKQCDDKAIIMEPYFSSIKNKVKIPSIQTELTLGMLSNTQYANDSEKLAIEKLFELYEYCLTAYKNTAISTYNAEYGGVFIEQITLSRENASDLYSGKITYGEYNKKTEERNKLGAQRIDALEAKYHEIELNNSINLMNKGVQMMTPPQPLMRNINCHQTGIYTNCQSW